VRPSFLPQFTLVPEDQPGADPDDLFRDLARDIPPPAVGVGSGAFAAARETAPVPVLRVEPRYPELLREAGLEGVVHLALTVGESGEVIAVRVIGPDAPAALVEAAVAAAWRWRFTPARQGVKPVRAVTSLSFAFRIR
jgi:TonB family protein